MVEVPEIIEDLSREVAELGTAGDSVVVVVLGHPASIPNKLGAGATPMEEATIRPPIKVVFIADALAIIIDNAQVDLKCKSD